MPANVRYSTSDRTVGGRNGRTTTLNGSLDVKPSRPNLSPASPSIQLIGWTGCSHGI